MCGKATLAIEVSSTSINAASATVMAISHGLTLGFQAVVSIGLGLAMCLAGAGDVGCNSGNSVLLSLYSLDLAGRGSAAP
jgi:hypothetical protein